MSYSQLVLLFSIFFYSYMFKNIYSFLCGSGVTRFTPVIGFVLFFFLQAVQSPVYWEDGQMLRSAFRSMRFENVTFKTMTDQKGNNVVNQLAEK